MSSENWSIHYEKVFFLFIYGKCWAFSIYLNKLLSHDLNCFLFVLPAYTIYIYWGSQNKDVSEPETKALSTPHLMDDFINVFFNVSGFCLSTGDNIDVVIPTPGL